MNKKPTNLPIAKGVAFALTKSGSLALMIDSNSFHPLDHKYPPKDFNYPQRGGMWFPANVYGTDMGAFPLSKTAGEVHASEQGWQVVYEHGAAQAYPYSPSRGWMTTTDQPCGEGAD
jgi:hypothetical protein